MPLTSLSFTCTSDPAEARTWFVELIEREPVAMSIVASVIDAVTREPERYEGPRWWAGRHSSGQVSAAFMHTPPFPLHVALATAEEARALAAMLAAEGDALTGVGGPRVPAEAFRDEWVARTGASAATEMEVGAFDLPVRPQLPYGVDGEYRRAEPAELPLVASWAQAFSDAVGHPGGSRPPSLRAHLEAGRVGFWVDGGRAVSMAYASPANGGVTRISGVWTPPALRGRGYASGVVAALSAERMDAGELCMLFTDLANPTSNKIYQAIGYRRIGDNITIAFT